MKRTLKRQINEFVKKGETMVNIINYLFTCDYSPAEIVEMLVKDFKCDRHLLKDTFYNDFGMDMSLYVMWI